MTHSMMSNDHVFYTFMWIFYRAISHHMNPIRIMVNYYDEISDQLWTFHSLTYYYTIFFKLYVWRAANGSC